MAENMRRRQKIMTELVETLRGKKARTEPSSSSCQPRFSMKLLIDNNGKRVLFAEAGKDCVDFLFYILSLPVSTLIRLVGKQGMTGSVANLYHSVETLDGSFILPNVTKDSLLELPITPKFCGYNNIPGSAASTDTNVFESPLAICPTCRNLMSKRTLTHVAQGGGFVKDAVKFMVMDDLVVKPVSIMSSINLITELGVKNCKNVIR